MKKAVFVLILILGIVYGVFCQNTSPAVLSGPMDLVVLLDTSASMSNSYRETSDYLVGPFLREFLRIGDTFHLISFSDSPRVEISRRIEAVGDVEAVIGRLLLMYPLDPQSDVSGALSFAEKYSSSLTGGRPSKVILISDGDAPSTQNLVNASLGRLKNQGGDLQFIKVPVTGNGPSSGRPQETRPAQTAQAAAAASSGGKSSAPASQSAASQAGQTQPAAASSQTQAQTAPAGAAGTSRENAASGSVSETPPAGQGGSSQQVSSGGAGGTGQSSSLSAQAEPSTQTSTAQTSDQSSAQASGQSTAQTSGQSTAQTSGQSTTQTSGQSTAQTSGQSSTQTSSSQTQGQNQSSMTASASETRERGSLFQGDIPLPLIIALIILILLILGLIIFLAARRLHNSPNRVMAQAAAPMDNSDRIEAQRQEQIRGAELMDSYAKGQKNQRKPLPKDKVYDEEQQEGEGPMMLNLFVEDQNTAIGRRNIHTLKSGYTYSIGGGKSDFLVFLVPIPPHIADVQVSGNNCTLVPRKPQYFPDIGSQSVPGCIGKTIRVISDKNYELFIRMERYQDPLIALNKMLNSISVPGEIK